MILVLSTDFYEQSTDPVVEWLARSGCSFLRLTMQDLVTGRADIEVDVLHGDIRVEGISLCQEINVIWYRRMLHERPSFKTEDNPKLWLLEENLKQEASAILDFLFYLLRDKTWLPHFSAVRLNKLIMLHKAAQHGIKVPASMLFTRGDKLNGFYTDLGTPIITKPVSKNVVYVEKEKAYVAFTKKMDPENMQLVPRSFFASLYQEYIPSNYEVRVFFLDGDFEAIAMLPADGQEVPEDIKLARMAGSLHYQRFLLEEDEKALLTNLLQELRLNSCTLDLLWQEDEMVLLDINPLGQFMFESQHSNTYLEKKIAQWLIRHDRTKKTADYAYH